MVSLPAGRVMNRLFAVAACVLASASSPSGCAWSAGGMAGHRVIQGKGTFPRSQPLSIPTEAALRFIAALPPRGLAALDGEGTLSIFDVARTGLSVIGRYGSVASAGASVAAVRLGQDRTGIALVAPEGRLLVWSDGALRAYDVGSPLSRRTTLVPVVAPGRLSDDLLAVAQDGAVVLIGGLAAGGPRVVARADVHALLDGKLALVDLDGDGVPEAVILTDPTSRHLQGAQADVEDATSVTVIGLRPTGLEVRGRVTLPPPAAFEALIAPADPIQANPRVASVLLLKSAPGRGSVTITLGWRDDRPAIVAEGPAVGQGPRAVDVIGAADLTGDGVPEIIAVEAGAVTAYRRVGASLQRVAQATGYASRAAGQERLTEALIADLDGDGRPQVIVSRQAGGALVGLALEGGRFVGRWSLTLRNSPESNVIVADLDGDGLLDLAVAGGRALHVFLSIP